MALRRRDRHDRRLFHDELLSATVVGDRVAGDLPEGDFFHEPEGATLGHTPRPFWVLEARPLFAQLAGFGV